MPQQRAKRTFTQEILDTLPLLVSISDASGQFIQVNRRWEETLGWTLADLRAAGTDVIVAVVDADADRRRVMDFLADPKGARQTFSVRCRDGTIVELSCSSFKLSDGTTLGIGEDVSDRDRAVESLRQSEQRFRLIATHSPDVSFHQDLQLRYTWLTNAGNSDLEQEAIGRTDWDLFTPAEARRLVDVKQRVLDSGHTYRGEQQLVAMGVPRWFDCVYQPDLDRSGLVVGLRGYARDVTDRKESEQAVVRAYERLESVLNSINDTNILLDRQWRYLYVNDAAVRATGTTRDQMTGRTLWECYPDLVGTVLERQYRRAMEERVPVTFEFHYPHTDRWWENRLQPVPEGLVSFATEITERKRAEVARAWIEAIVSASDDAMIGTALDGTIETSNAAAGVLCGYASEELVGRSIGMLFPVDQPHEVTAMLERLQRGEHITHHDAVWVREDGRQIDVTLTMSPIETPPRAVSGISVVARDATERKRIEAEMQSSHQQLRALSAHLQTIREEERARIAREVHDELGQMLTGLRIELSFLERVWREGMRHDAPSPPDGSFQKMEGLIDRSIQTVRKIATELRPMILDSLGLPAAIEWQTDEFEKTSGIPCEVSLPASNLPLDRETSTALFRILQESLTNILRHARARKVAVRLWAEDQITSLQVTDNGIGIRKEAINAGRSFGLLSMRERALMLGGSIDVRSSRRSGTTITVRVPQPPKQSPGEPRHRASPSPPQDVQPS